MPPDVEKRVFLDLVAAVVLCLAVGCASRLSDFPGRTTRVPIDHLEPVEPTLDERHVAIRRALVGEPELGCVRMIYRPAFEPDMAVAVYPKPPEQTADPADTDFEADFIEATGTVEYVVSLRVAATNLASAYHDPPEGKDHHPFRISETTVPLDSATAEKCFHIWNTMLLRTKYRELPWIGCDGYSAEFQLHTRHGRIWSPPPGLCRDFVDVGHELMRFCKADEEQKQRVHKELTRKLDAFIRALERTGGMKRIPMEPDL